jgi:hypothetical protein
MINPLHLKPVLKPMHNYIERTSDSCRKYAVIHIKNIARQVGLIQYSANTVAYKEIIFFNDNNNTVNNKRYVRFKWKAEWGNGNTS